MHEDDQVLFLGGEFANFHEIRRRASPVLQPATSSIGTALEISSTSSFVSFTLTVPTFSSRFLILVVPMSKKEPATNQSEIVKYFTQCSLMYL